MPAVTAQERLGELLKKCRTAAGLSQVQLADALGTDQGTVSRLERGRFAQPGATRVLSWLAHTHADEATAALANELVTRSDADMVRWEPLHDVGWDRHQKRYEDLEHQTRVIQVYQPSLIPGLLQSPAYATYLLGEVVKVPERELATAVMARLRRNGVLYRPHTRLDVVIAEHVLRTNMGGSRVMAEQLHLVADLAQRPTVDLAVVPTDTTMPETWGHAFVLLDMVDPAESRVLIELEEDELTITEPDRVQQYRDLHAVYRRHALTGQAAIDLVLAIAVQRDQEADQ